MMLIDGEWRRDPASGTTRGVSRHFGGVAALSDVSFSLPHRAVIGLMGPNGSGKTTLMNVISGVDAPTEGAVLLDGEPVQGLAANTLALRGIARTFQHIRLIPHLTAAQNVTLALRAPSARAFDDFAAPAAIGADRT